MKPTLKNLHLIILVILLSVASAKAQSALYQESFSSSSPSGITPSPSGSWFRSTATPVSNSAGASGGGYYRTAASTSNADRQFTLDNSISVTGYKNISIVWTGYRSSSRDCALGLLCGAWAANSNELELYYSANGGAFQKVEGWTESRQSYNTWSQPNSGVPIKLPADANNATLRFYWKINVIGGQYFAIDDISVMGTSIETPGAFSWSSRPNNENPFTASSRTSGSPYTLDGVAMRWSGTVGTGVTLNEAVTSDTRFQSPTRVLSLMQSGASSTEGTSISIAFDEPISGLSFTIFDVDQATGQFQDRIVETGVNSDGQMVILPGQSVLPNSTAATKYNDTSGAVYSVSGSDIPASSEQGNVKITFTEPVKQVNIAYFNSDAARGQQGIGIYDFNGSRIMAPLPVELVSFRAQRQDGSAKLVWATAMEKDNERFIVERSEDGKAFQAIGQVKGHGTSAIANNYSFTDLSPASGYNYYRLRQVDTDGTEVLSRVIAIEFTSMESRELATVYPTLVSFEVNIRHSDSDHAISVAVLDATGRQVAAFGKTNETLLILPVQHLMKGVYFVKVTDGERQETTRIIKQ